MAPLLVVILCAVLANAGLAFWVASDRDGGTPEDIEVEGVIGNVDGTLAGSATTFAKESKADDPATVMHINVVDADNLLGADLASFTESLQKWLFYQGHVKQSLVKVTQEKEIGSDAWTLRCSVSGASDDVVAGRSGSGWGFGWAKVIAKREAEAKKAEEERLAAERAAQEAAAAEAQEQEWDGWQDDSSSWEPEPSASTETVEIQEAYVEVYDVGGLCAYIPPECAGGLQGALVSWAENTAGLRNADAAYLVASTVSGWESCSFTVIVPSGMVDGDLNWIDVPIRCSWSGGSFSFSY